MRSRHGLSFLRDFRIPLCRGNIAMSHYLADRFNRHSLGDTDHAGKCVPGLMEAKVAVYAALFGDFFRWGLKLVLCNIGNSFPSGAIPLYFL